MLFPILVTSLLLHQVHFTATLYDCYYLRRICRIDPDCPDETAFYSKCQRTDSQTSLVLTYGRNGDSNNNNNVGGISVYSLYQREALRESLYLLKEKLHQHNIEVKEHGTRDVDEHKLDENYQQQKTPIKHFSDSNKETENKREELLTKYLISRNSEGGGEGKKGKKDLIDKAFDLVQLLIQQHDARKEKSNAFPKQKLNSKKEALQDKNSEKREVKEGGYQGFSNDEVKDLENHDHFEVATPVYTENSNLREAIEINPQDPEYQPLLHQQQRQQQQQHGRLQQQPQQQQEQHEILQPSVEISVNKRSNDGTLILNASSPLSHSDAVSVGLAVGKALWNVTSPVLKLLEVSNNTATYALQIPSLKNLHDDDIDSVVGKLNNDKLVLAAVLQNTGTNIVSAGVTSHPSPPPHKKKHWDKRTLFSIIVGASVLLLLSVAIGVVVVKRKGNEFSPLGFRKNEVMEDYQELCRTKMSIVNSPHPEEQMDKKIEQQQQVSKVWGEEGSPYNMDITTGHVILNYMEDHLHDAERLSKEWEALCAYKADDSCTSVGSEAKHATKNRYRDVLPYDTKRVTLRESSNAFHSDYINASFITDTHPRTPAYIATQGPLDNTVGDFWQMVWERGIVVIINLTKLSDMGLPQCHRYWPTDGSQTYHVYEVHLISEHIWCDDYLVRSLYLKKLNTCETRTVTQFHFVSWSHLSVPQSPTPLLEFRRKVNRCYRGSQCPVLVHCNNGVGRTGTYILLDLVLNRMLKGVKEIDIAATLEHLRDQRGGMVKTKQQFEFVLLATAQEVSTILDAVTTK